VKPYDLQIATYHGYTCRRLLLPLSISRNEFGKIAACDAAQIGRRQKVQK